jgi:hypothetical protein
VFTGKFDGGLETIQCLHSMEEGDLVLSSGTQAWLRLHHRLKKHNRII